MRKEIIFKYIVRVLVVLLAIGAVYNIFFEEDLSVNPMSNEKIEYNNVNEVNLSMVQPDTLNPLTSTDEDVFYVSKLIYSSLFTSDEYMTPTKDLVESYSINENTVKIRLKRVKFHNGENLNASDVVFTVNAIKNAGKKSVYYEKVSNIDSIDGNGRRVTITFKNGESSLSQLDFPILPSDEYGDYTQLKKTDNNFKPIGSGKYKVARFNEGKELVLKGYDGYYGDKPTNVVNVKMFKKGSNFTRLTESSNITVSVDKSENRDTKISKKDIKTVDFTGNQIEFIGFNLRNQFIADKNVRQAIAYAIDCDKIIEEDYYKKIIHSNTLYLPGYLGVQDNQEVYKYDLDKASELLKKAGLEDTDDDDVVNDKNGKEFTVRILVNESNDARVSVAERMEDDLKSIGIDSEVLEYNTASYKKALKSGRFDIYIGGMSIDNTMNFTSLLRSNGKNNFGRYNDEKSDEYLNGLYTGKNVDESGNVLSKYKEYLVEEIPYYCIGYKTFGIVESPAFQGEISASFTNPYKGIEHWSCSYEVRVPIDTEEETDEDK